MNLRVAITSFVASCALYMLLVVFNNITDYGSNFDFVKHVFGMDTTFPGNEDMWRAITSPVLHHIAYVSIITWEASCAFFLTLGAWRLWQARAATTAVWSLARAHATTGLALGILLWLLAFITVGGEWFLMWQSSKWNGLGPATRMFTIMGVVLVLLYLPENKPAADSK